MVGGRKPKIQRKRVYKTVPLDGAGDEPTEDQAGGEVGGRQRRRPSEERTESPQPPTASASGRGRGRRPSATSSSQRGRLEEPPLKQKDDGDDDDDDNKDLVDDDVEDTGDTGERLSDDDGDDSLQMGDDDGDELPGANADVDGLARFTDNDDADVEYERLVAKKEARRQKFEQEKRSILDQLPASYLETFGEVGFGKFGAKYFPVMILGPYDVPSGPPSNLRDKWTAAFETMKRQDRLEHIHTVRIVYWYGAEPSQAYGTITPKEFVSYNEGVRKGLLEKAYQAALRKQEEGKKQLTKAERELVRGMAELLDDSSKPREDRNRIKIEFLEIYDYEDSSPDVPTTEPPARKRKRQESNVAINEGDDTAPSSSTKLKKKRGRPRKSASIVSLSSPAILEVAVSETADKNEETEQPKPKRKKRVAKNPKKSAEPAEDEGKAKEGIDNSSVDELTVDLMEKRHEEGTDRGAAPQFVSPPAAASAANTELANNVGGIEDIGDAEDDDSLGEDAKDDSFDFADDDMQDEDFDKGQGKKKQNKSRKKGGKDVPLKKEKEIKLKPANLKPLKETRPIEPVEREKKDYKRCCKEYSPLVEGLDQAVLDKNFNVISSTLHAFLDAAEHFSAPYLEHQVAPAVKQAKALLKESKREDILKVMKALNGKLSSVYNQKKSLVPLAFKLPKGLAKKPSSATAEKPAPSKQALEAPTSVTQQEPSEESASKPPATSERSSIQEAKTPIARKEQFKKEVPPEAAPTVAKAQPKTSFSLGQFGQKIQRDHVQEIPKQGHNSQSLPPWVVGPVPTTEAPSEEDRILGLEFLLVMAQQLPSDRVDARSVSVALERALYQWATSPRARTEDGSSKPGKAPWVRPYWERLHAIVAGVCGKKDSVGTLANLVVSGHYATPTKLVELADDDFAKSFNGQPLL